MQERDQPSSIIPMANEYLNFQRKWEVIDDCLGGPDVIKAAGETYLHKTMGMRLDALFGESMYDDYVYKADFPDYTLQFLENMFGLLWQKEPIVDLPDEMTQMFLPAPAYVSNKSFFDVYRETSEKVLKYGRHGILLDVPDIGSKSADVYPLMIQYDTWQIKHWGTTVYKGREVLKFVVLDESFTDFETQDLSATERPKYRFLGLATKDRKGNQLDTPIYYTYTGEDKFTAIFDPPSPRADGTVDHEGKKIYFPRLNGQYAKQIPFFCFGSVAMELSPKEPILYPLCQACLSIYRSSADYAEYLYKQSFALLFGKGIQSDTIYMGTQKAITVMDEKADLKFVEISGDGLEEQRVAYENKHKYAINIGMSLLTGNNVTGESAKTTINVKTASLKSISKTLADGFIALCKFAGEWKGLSDSEISKINVQPNMEFASSSSAQSTINNFTVFNGGGMTSKDYYNKQYSNGDTVYPNYEDWKAAMEEAFILYTKRLEAVKDANSDPVVADKDGVNSYASLTPEQGGDRQADAFSNRNDGKSAERTAARKAREKREKMQ